MPASLFAQPCRFIAGAGSAESLPPATHPEIAIVGRSNAGKSSLLNALVGQRTLARTSQKPGHTQQLNFFLLGEALMLVDMPGYGFARVSKQKKDDWDALIGGYMIGRRALKRVLLLIDARRGVMRTDEEFMRRLDNIPIGFQLVLTKVDEVSPAELISVLQSLKKTIQSHAAAHPQVVATSALKKKGIEELQEQLVPFAAG